MDVDNHVTESIEKHQLAGVDGAGEEELGPGRMTGV
jgi:hypothetical protein